MKQSAMSPRTGRIIELDIAKGLGILSVILYNTLPASPLHTALGGYMMPLFFVVSGLVMQRDACSFSLRRFWEKNARLLFYYILFSAIYLLCSAVTCIAGHGSYKALALDGIAALVGCGFNVLWFFSALFLGKLLCSLLTGSPLPRWAQGLFLAGLFLLAAGIGRAVDFTALSGVSRVLGIVGLTALRTMEAAFYLFIGTLLQGAFRSLRKRCTKPAMVVACGIGGTVVEHCQQTGTEVSTNHQTERHGEGDNACGGQSRGQQYSSKAGVADNGEHRANQRIQQNIAGQRGKDHLNAVCLGDRRYGLHNQLQR